MASVIQVGPKDNMHLPQQSLGMMFFNELQKKNSNDIILVDYTTNEEVTYNQLLKVSVNLANALTKLGVKKGDVITIASENNWKYLASILAGFFIGATVNLLNHDYTSQELKYFLKICKPTLIFCTIKTLENVLKLKDESFFYAKSIIIYNGKSQFAENFDEILEKTTYDEDFKPVVLEPEVDVGLILTSSGTTGFPKCVMLTHANLRIIMLYSSQPDYLDINKGQRTIGFLPFFHMFGYAISLASILFESKYIIVNRFNPMQILQIIQDYKITKLFAVPPVLQFLITSPLVDHYDVSSIQDIVYGAAPSAKHSADIVKKRLNTKSVRQLYGMTESSGAVTITPKNVANPGTVGKVVVSYQIKVCDVKTGKPLPPHEIGELRISGPGVMKGYLGNNVESKNILDEEGFLKSGDLGYYDEDGFFYMVDRLKEIIKYKGFQVSPAELENLLLQHQAVKDAAVIGIPDERAGEVPLAFVVKQSDKNVTEEELVLFIEEQVSVHKRLYGGVRFIDEIPKTASGKILRRKLLILYQQSVIYKT